jgi:hypothetical protein
MMTKKLLTRIILALLSTLAYSKLKECTYKAGAGIEPYCRQFS